MAMPATTLSMAATGDDVVIGGTGTDVATLGDGDDLFIWNQGDGSDTVLGQDGFDTMLFNGAPITEDITISTTNDGRRSSAPRATSPWTYTVSSASRSLLSEGQDHITVNDLAGSGVKEVAIDLATSTGRTSATVRRIPSPSMALRMTMSQHNGRQLRSLGQRIVGRRDHRACGCHGRSDDQWRRRQRYH
jgi:Ca2+-binding RTX toxin-like protein